MVCGEHSKIGLSEDEANMMVAFFNATRPPPKNVAKTADGNGTFTVKGTWEPCPPGTVSDPI